MVPGKEPTDLMAQSTCIDNFDGTGSIGTTDRHGARVIWRISLSSAQADLARRYAIIYGIEHAILDSPSHRI
jgi:hypothetical protein